MKPQRIGLRFGSRLIVYRTYAPELEKDDHVIIDGRGVRFYVMPWVECFVLLKGNEDAPVSSVTLQNFSVRMYRWRWLEALRLITEMRWRPKRKQ